MLSAFLVCSYNLGSSPSSSALENLWIHLKTYQGSSNLIDQEKVLKIPTFSGFNRRSLKTEAEVLLARNDR